MKLKEGRVSAWTIDLSKWKQIPEVVFEKAPGSMLVDRPHNIKIKALWKWIDKPLGTEPEWVWNSNRELFLTTIDTSNLLVKAIDFWTMKILDLHRRREVLQSNSSLLSDPVKV